VLADPNHDGSEVDRLEAVRGLERNDDLRAERRWRIHGDEEPADGKVVNQSRLRVGATLREQLRLTPHRATNGCAVF